MAKLNNAIPETRLVGLSGFQTASSICLFSSYWSPQHKQFIASTKYGKDDYFKQTNSLIYSLSSFVQNTSYN